MGSSPRELDAKNADLQNADLSPCTATREKKATRRLTVVEQAGEGEFGPVSHLQFPSLFQVACLGVQSKNPASQSSTAGVWAAIQ